MGRPALLWFVATPLSINGAGVRDAFEAFSQAREATRLRPHVRTQESLERTGPPIKRKFKITVCECEQKSAETDTNSALTGLAQQEPVRS